MIDDDHLRGLFLEQVGEASRVRYVVLRFQEGKPLHFNAVVFGYLKERLVERRLGYDPVSPIKPGMHQQEDGLRAPAGKLDIVGGKVLILVRR